MFTSNFSVNKPQVVPTVVGYTPPTPSGSFIVMQDGSKTLAQDGSGILTQ